MDTLRYRLFILLLLGLAVLPLATGSACGYAENSLPGDEPRLNRDSLEGFVQEWNPLCFNTYWDDGVRFDSPEKNIRIKIGGRLQADGGYIGADESVQDAFPGLVGWQGEIRRLRVSILAKFYDRVDFKIEADFSDVPALTDAYFDIKRVPFIGVFRFGHTKEPFSLEELTSSNNITFMERSLPTSAFAPGRNIGPEIFSTALDQRLTWAAGGFWDVGSITSRNSPKDALSNATGFNLTARVTGLPWYAENGRKLVHLGLGYSHKFRTDRQIRFLTRPESNLANSRLVDTGQFAANDADLIDYELAFVHGPLSMQAEFYQNFTEGSQDHYFWGYYVYLSYIITGESRPFDKSEGIFTALKPRNSFNPFRREWGWGAWELALRHSYLDLDDGSVQGGRENNLTAGLNWYLNANVRLMFNYIHARVEDRASPELENGYANIVQSRFQIFF